MSSKVSKPSSEASEGVERCPICGALQDWSDQWMTVGVGDDLVRMWACNACGHPFKTWGGKVLESGQWPMRQSDGSYEISDGIIWGRETPWDDKTSPSKDESNP